MSTTFVEHEVSVWHWRDCQNCRLELMQIWPREEPAAPQVGQGWYDEQESCLYVWDGDEWVTVPLD